MKQLFTLLVEIGIFIQLQLMWVNAGYSNNIATQPRYFILYDAIPSKNNYLVSFPRKHFNSKSSCRTRDHTIPPPPPKKKKKYKKEKRNGTVNTQTLLQDTHYFEISKKKIWVNLFGNNMKLSCILDHLRIPFA